MTNEEGYKRPAALEHLHRELDEDFAKSVWAHVTGETVDGRPVELTILQGDLTTVDAGMFLAVDGRVVYHDYEVIPDVLPELKFSGTLKALDAEATG